MVSKPARRLDLLKKSKSFEVHFSRSWRRDSIIFFAPKSENVKRKRLQLQKSIKMQSLSLSLSLSVSISSLSFYLSVSLSSQSPLPFYLSVSLSSQSPLSVISTSSFCIFNLFLPLLPSWVTEIYKSLNQWREYGEAKGSQEVYFLQSLWRKWVGYLPWKFLPKSWRDLVA